MPGDVRRPRPIGFPIKRATPGIARRGEIDSTFGLRFGLDLPCNVFSEQPVTCFGGRRVAREG